MNNLIPTARLLHVRQSEEVCYCALHRGELLQQIDAQLPSGRQLRVMKDSYGYRIAIGSPNLPDDVPCPSAISEAEAIQILRNTR